MHIAGSAFPCGLPGAVKCSGGQERRATGEQRPAVAAPPHDEKMWQHATIPGCDAKGHAVWPFAPVRAGGRGSGCCIRPWRERPVVD
jgi:hypothetical protein